ncbi:hypothetical protein TYRP_020652 [Tyrophagus putrescentiae]|nr:hypothetical protein TYRP_020652 [Tyrophagus putrescentiae]
MTMDELRTGSTTSFAAFLQQRASKRKKSSNTAALAAARQLFCGKQQPSQTSIFKEIELKLNCASMEYRLPRFEALVEHLQSRKMRALDEAVDGFGGSDLTNTDHSGSSPKKSASFFDKDSLWNNSSPIPAAFDQADFDLDGIVITSSSKNRRPSRADELQQLFATKNYDLLLKELLPLVAQLLNLVESSANQHVVEGAAVYLLWVFFDASSLNHLANCGNSSSNGTTQQQQPQQNQNLQSLGLGLGMFGPAGMGGSSSSSSNNNSSSSNHFGNSNNSNNNSNSNSSSSTFSSIATINLAALGANYPSLEYLFCLDSLNGGILERIGYVARSLFELMEPVYLNTVFYHASMIRKAARDVEAQEVQQQSTPSNNGGDQNGAAAAAQEQEDWFSRLEQKLLGSKKTSTEDEEEEVAGDEVDSPVSSSSSSSPFTVDPFEKRHRRLVEKSGGTAFSTHFNFEHPNAEFVFQALLSGGRLPPLPADIANLNLNGSTAAAANAQGGEVGGSVKFPEQQRKQFEAQTSSSTGGSSAEDAIGLLFSELATFIATYNSTHLGEQYYLSHEELFNTVLSWIIDQQQGQQQNSKNGDETLGTELTNLLGEDSASLITKIITVYKPAILKSSSSLSGSGTSAAAKNVNNSGRNNNNNNSSLERAETLWRKVCQAKGLQGVSNNATNVGPTNLGPSIVVHTEKEKVLKKEMRKIEKKFNKELSKAAK